MKTVTLNGKKYGFMQPERLLAQQMSKAATITIGKDVWQIIGKASEATEEQAAGIVESTGLGAYNDEDEYFEYIQFKDYNTLCIESATARESLHSLIRSLDMQPETTIILQKQ